MWLKKCGCAITFVWVKCTADVKISDVEKSRATVNAEWWFNSE